GPTWSSVSWSTTLAPEIRALSLVIRASSRPCSFLAAWYSKFSDRSPNPRAVAIASIAAALRGPSSSASSAWRACICSLVSTSPPAMRRRLPASDLLRGPTLRTLVGRVGGPVGFLTVDLPPVAHVELGERRVTLGLGVHPRELETVGERERRRVHLGTADDEDLVVERRGRCDRVRDAPGDADLRRAGIPRRASRHDDRRPPGEWMSDRLVRLPPHHEDVAERQLLEPAQVVGEVPREPAVDADDAVPRDRGDDRDGHTAIGPRIAGCGSYPSTCTDSGVKSSSERQAG